jgi:hypothetical protein
MGIDDSRTPIVTAPVDLILSRVGLAAKEARGMAKPSANVALRKMMMSLRCFMGNLLNIFWNIIGIYIRLFHIRVFNFLP